MNTFTVTLNNEQREMLIAALGNYAYPGHYRPSQREQLDLLVVMLHAAHSGKVINDFTK